MLKYLLRLFIFTSVIAHCADPCMADAPLIWGPSNSAQLLNSGNLVAANGYVYVPSSTTLSNSIAIITDASGFLTNSTTTATELGYVHGVTSAIQTQLNGKQASLTFPLAANLGGSGVTSPTANSVLLGNGASAFQTVAPGTGGNVLTSSGGTWVSAAPATSGTVTSVGYTGPGGIFSVTGSPVTGSGTIAESVAGTSGGIPYFSTASILSSSAALTASQLVLGGGAGAAPTSLAAGSQYNVLTMGATNPGYGQVNLAQSAAVTGLLPVANGGTGLGTLTANDLVVGAGTSVPTFIAPGTSGNALLSNGTTWASTAITQGLPVTYESATFTAVAGNAYAVNTTSAAATCNLPAGSAGARILLIDDAGTFATNNLTITPNGTQTIQGITAGSSLVANLSGALIFLTWDATNSYWTVSANGFQYGPTASTTLAGILQLKAPTQTIYTSGSGTYTVPTGVLWLRVRMVGGGGGGAASDNSTPPAATAGGATTFGSSFLTSNGGALGTWGSSVGGVGGTASIGSGATGVALSGGSGQAGNYGYASFINSMGGSGGASAFGGAGGGTLNATGNSAAINSGSGGGGAGSGTTSNFLGGSGGGAGGFIDAIISAPGSTYSYAVGSGGSGGTNTNNGGAGGSGIIIIEEHYY